MKKELDIQIKICEIENKISKETGSPDRVNELKTVLRTLNWVLENDTKC